MLSNIMYKKPGKNDGKDDDTKLITESLEECNEDFKRKVLAAVKKDLERRRKDDLKVKKNAMPTKITKKTLKPLIP